MGVVDSPSGPSTSPQRICGTLLTVSAHSTNHSLGLEPDAFLSCINILSVPYTVFSNTMHLHTHNHDQSVLFEVSIMTGCNNKLLDKAPRSSIFLSSLSLVKDEFFLNSAFWP